MKNVIFILISLFFIDTLLAQDVLYNKDSDNTQVSGVISSNSESNCYKTIDNLFITSDENGLVEDGERAIFVAENSIVFGPGFKAVAGSYMHAYITSNYCPELPESIIANQNGNTGDFDENSSANDFQSMLDENDIRIYPNPTNGIFHIDFLNNPIENAEIFVFDFKGQRIQNLNTQNRMTIDIDLSYLPKGTYLVLIKDAENLIRRKIVKL